MENLCMRLLFYCSSLFLFFWGGGGFFLLKTFLKQIKVAFFKEQCGRINRMEQDVPWIMALGPSSPGDILHNSNPWWTVILFIYITQPCMVQNCCTIHLYVHTWFGLLIKQRVLSQYLKPSPSQWCTPKAVNQKTWNKEAFSLTLSFTTCWPATADTWSMPMLAK